MGDRRHGIRGIAWILAVWMAFQALPLRASAEGWTGFAGTSSDVLQSSEYYTVRFLLETKWWDKPIPWLREHDALLCDMEALKQCLNEDIRHNRQPE